MYKLLLIIAMNFPMHSNAGLFGASNYDECMSDGKVGRTNAELRLLTNKCRKEFPALPKLYALKDTEFSCVDNHTNSRDDYKFVKNIMYRGKFKMLATRTKEKITVIEDINNAETKRLMKGFLTINTLDGTGTFYIKEVNFSASFNCTEN